MWDNVATPKFRAYRYVDYYRSFCIYIHKKNLLEPSILPLPQLPEHTSI